MISKNKFSDTEVKLSYDVMTTLRDGLYMNTYQISEFGRNTAVIRLFFRTKDGKTHQIANTEIEL